MAKAPFLNLKKEDFPEVTEKWLEKLFRALNEYSKRNEYALTGRLSITDNINAYWKKGTIEIKAKDPRIVTVPHDIGAKQVGRDILFNGTWSASGTSLVPPYVNRFGNLVFLTGSCVAGASGVTTLIFKLPSDYRPKNDIRFLVNYYTNTTANGFLWVRTNGDVELTATNGSAVAINSQFTFNTTFPLEQIIPLTYKGSVVDTTGFPFKFKNEIKDNRPPLAILVAQAFDVSDKTRTKIPASLFGVAYDIQGSDIFIYNIGGALGGRTYEITFLILGD